MISGKLVIKFPRSRGTICENILQIFPRQKRKVMLSLCNTMIAEENFENLTDGTEIYCLVESKGFLVYTLSRAC